MSGAHDGWRLVEEQVDEAIVAGGNGKNGTNTGLGLGEHGAESRGSQRPAESLPEMRVLTVRQPWAWAIIHGGKDVENRVRNIAGAHRGPVAIHAALQWDDAVTWNPLWQTVLAAMKADGSDPWDAPWQNERGEIIGVVDLVDSHPFEACIQQQNDGDWLVCSAWAERAGHHLVLAHPRPLAEPIPYQGALGLRRLDADTIARIEEAIR